jgi:AAA15 family ATPase/GTPase
MSKHFIKNINIKKFKCFDNFEADGFARVNLITGKNNVGKTAFMEACHINASASYVETITGALCSIRARRENINILASLRNSSLMKYIKEHSQEYLEQTSGIVSNSNIRNCGFKVFEKNGIKEYQFNFLNKNIKVKVKDFSFETGQIENIEFIDNFGLSDLELVENFASIQKLDSEPFLNAVLNKFDNNIKSFKNPNNKPECKINDKYLPITELGDGTKHLISILVSLFRCRRGYLFIDEIDNGIHYSKLDELWEVILKTSKDLNVQVFATTHSQECIESYARVAKKLADEEVALIELGKKDEKIESIVFNYNGLTHHMEQKLEVRGW